MLTENYHNPTLLATTDSHTLGTSESPSAAFRGHRFHARQLTRLLSEQAGDAVSRAEWPCHNRLKNHWHVALSKFSWRVCRRRLYA